jgi:hypothetical protein
VEKTLLKAMTLLHGLHGGLGVFEESNKVTQALKGRLVNFGTDF